MHPRSRYSLSCTWGLAYGFVMLVACGQAHADDAVTVPEVRLVSLPNGIPLYHIAMPEDPSFALQVIVWGGLHADPPGKGGLGHVLEHLLFEQPDCAPDVFIRKISERGGTYQGLTKCGRWTYEVAMPKDALDIGADWLSRVVHHDTLQIEKLDNVRTIIRDEKNWNGSPNDTPDTFLSAVRFLAGHERDPWETAFGIRHAHESESASIMLHITPENLKRHYDAHYVAENMAILYAGPHSLDDISKVVQAEFGSVRHGTPPALHKITRTRFEPYTRYMFSSRDSYEAGYLLADPPMSEWYDRFFYTYVVASLLKDELRNRQSQTYSVKIDRSALEDASMCKFMFRSDGGSLARNSDLADGIIFGDLSRHLSEDDYQSYRKSFVNIVLQGRNSEDSLNALSNNFFNWKCENSCLTFFLDIASLARMSRAEFVSKATSLREISKPYMVQRISRVVPAFPILLLLFVLPTFVSQWRHRRHRPSETISDQQAFVWVNVLACLELFVVSAILQKVSESMALPYAETAAQAWLFYMSTLVLSALLMGCLSVVLGCILASRLTLGTDFLYLKTAGWRGIHIPYPSITEVEIRKMFPPWKIHKTAHTLALRTRYVAIHYGKRGILKLYVADPEKLQKFLQEKMESPQNTDAVESHEPDYMADEVVAMPASHETPLEMNADLETP